VATTGRARRLAVDAGDLVARFRDCIERRNREFGRAEKGEA
jgi:hypothetical protein